MTLWPSDPTPSAAGGADAAWDEAFLRVESYLRAHGLESRLRLNQITSEIIAMAREQAQPGQVPLRLAMDLTHARIGAWLARAGRKIDWIDERRRAQGRLALILADLPGRWADDFLSASPVPPELSAALNSARILPGPEVHLTNMSPAPLEFSLPESMDLRWGAKAAWFRARMLVSWLLIVGFFGFVWAASR